MYWHVLLAMPRRELPCQGDGDDDPCTDLSRLERLGEDCYVKVAGTAEAQTESRHLGSL